MPDLVEAAGKFADDLTDRLRAVLPGQEGNHFVAVLGPPPASGGATRVSVHSEPRALPVLVVGSPVLEAVLDFQCRWDHVDTYLAVDASGWAVRYVQEATPLFRIEFLSRMSNPMLPCAHLHVHAHRDEFMFAMVAAERGRPRSRTNAIETGSSAPPRLSDVHFPLGGPRMRPCVEDLYSLLIAEFGADAAPGHLAAIEAGRMDWRRMQTGAAVRDTPSEAARVLAELGYDVTPPEAGHRPDREDRLKRF